MDKILALLQHYNFEFGNPELGNSVSDRSQNLVQFLNQKWQNYQLNWVHLAVVEAIYQGRYKVASVDYILGFWQKRSAPICRFDRDFERIICSDFGLSCPIRRISTTTDSSNQTTKLATVQAQATELKEQHRVALKQMQLLAESSLFVDKLKSMCDLSLIPELLSDIVTENLITESENQLTNIQQLSAIAKASLASSGLTGADNFNSLTTAP